MRWPPSSSSSSSWRAVSERSEVLRHVRDGIPASPGIVIGPALVLHWEVPRVPRPTIPEADVEAEIERFHAAREWAKARIRALREDVAERLGQVEAQIVMLDDVDLIEPTIAYIKENHFSAARAFELRMLEFQSAWRRSGHPMVVERLNDLLDVQLWVTHHLLGLPEPDFSLSGVEQPV